MHAALCVSELFSSKQYSNFPKSHVSSVCFFFWSVLKVFEEQLVLSLDDDDDEEEYPSSLSGNSSLMFSLDLSESIYSSTSRT